MLTENKTTEFKREYVDDIKNTIIAFANCDGGTLFIGLNDDGSVCGVDDVDETMLRVTNAIRDTVRPDITMFMECRNEIMDGKKIVSVTVQRGTARPYYLHSKGIRPEGVYVRQGASTVPASDAAILNMIKETSGDSYETARSINQQLTFEKASNFFKKRNVEFGNAQMKTLHLIGDDNTYTNLAFLLSEQCSHTIKLAVFEGSKKSVFKDRQELSGSLLEQLEEAFSYIDRYNRTRAEFSGLDRVDMRDYPVEAVREALLNAIVHRDYSFSGPTLISIFEDRIEFVTIGGLVKGISLDDVKLGVSVLRNQYLANIFYRLKLIEAYGTGILKINECYDEYMEKPLIETTDHAFKITLPNTNYHIEKCNTMDDTKNRGMMNLTKKEERINTVLELCHRNGYVVRKDIEEELGISQATAILLLRELTEDGTLLKRGKAKNLRYYENR
ncbi:MAG: putative DNA binding domain-containing protein [Lachnospiraceae bacterium]|nr:putative DNA binding domain-containing protein [Lachnospiraceae bacterium]